MIYDHYRRALQLNNRKCTTQHIVSLTIMVNNGKKQTTTKQKTQHIVSLTIMVNNGKEQTTTKQKTQHIVSLTMIYS